LECFWFQMNNLPSVIDICDGNFEFLVEQVLKFINDDSILANTHDEKNDAFFTLVLWENNTNFQKAAVLAIVAYLKERLESFFPNDCPLTPMLIKLSRKIYSLQLHKEFSTWKIFRLQHEKNDIFLNIVQNGVEEKEDICKREF